MTSTVTSTNVNTNIPLAFGLVKHGLHWLPVELMIEIAYFLSVRDICNVRATSRNLRLAFGHSSIWSTIFREILVAMPIWRISTSAPPKGDALIASVVELAKNEHYFSNPELSPLNTLSTHHSKYPPRFLQLLAGGNYYFCLWSTQKHGIYEAVSGKLVIPFRSKLKVVTCAITPCSVDEFRVAITYKLEGFDSEAHVLVYQCKPLNGSCKLVLQTPVIGSTTSTSMTATSLIVVWYSRVDRAFKVLYTRFDGMEKPSFIKFRIPSFRTVYYPHVFTITLASDYYFFLGCRYERSLYRIPYYPALNEEEEPMVSALWRLEKRSRSWESPRFLLQPSELISSSSGSRPPSFFGIWTGNQVLFMERDRTQPETIDQIAYKYSKKRLNPPKHPIRDGGSVGICHAIDNTSFGRDPDGKDGLHIALRFNFAEEHASQRLNLRMGRPESERLNKLNIHIWKYIKRHERIYNVSYDEE